MGSDAAVNRMVGGRLKELREQRQMSLNEFAKRVGTSASMVWDIENGNRRLHVDKIIQFSDFYGVSTDYVLCRTNEPLPGRAAPADLSPHFRRAFAGMAGRLDIIELVNACIPLGEEQIRALVALVSAFAGRPEEDA